MIVKTDKIKEKGISIGMFSRGGKATILLDNHFRDKNDEEKFRKNFSEKNLRNEEDDENKKKYTRPASSLLECRGSFYFHTTSRDQHPIFKREKTPDPGIYRPKYESIHSKSRSFIYRPASLSTIANIPTPDENIKKEKEIIPLCLIDGNTCDFRLRNIKKQIDNIRQQINNSNIDVQTLFNEKIIDEKTYSLFKSSSLTLLQNYESQPKANAALLALQQNPNNLINLINQYYSLKNDIRSILTRNIDDLNNRRLNIADRPRIRSTTPLELRKQLSRPDHNRRKNDYSAEYSMNKSYMNEAFHKIHKFESATPRKTFMNKNKSLGEYDITNDILNKTRPISKAFIDFERYYPRKLQAKRFLNTTVDVIDINQQTDNMRKTTTIKNNIGRNEHKFRETDLSILKRSPFKNTQDSSVSFFDKIPGIEYSFLNPFKINI